MYVEQKLKEFHYFTSEKIYISDKHFFILFENYFEKREKALHIFLIKN